MFHISSCTRHTAYFFLITLPLNYFLFSEYINLDFWYDELYTLANFVFVDLMVIVQDYHVPNNHIFFNLLNHIYLSSINNSHIHVLMDRPYLIRLLMLSYTVFTLVYLYRIGRRFFNDLVAIIALAVLATTIPYYNFAVQVRGYSMSTMLLTMMIYYLLRYEKDGRKGDAIITMLLGALSIYTIPSNIYYLMSVTFYYTASGIVSEWLSRRNSGTSSHPSKKSHESQPLLDRATRKSLIIVLLMGGSLGIAILLYSPVLGYVINNQWVKSDGMFNVNTIQHVMPQTFLWFLSKRYLLLPITVCGMFGCGVLWVKGKETGFERIYLFYLCLLILPFVFSFIRGDNPFYRTFINLVPVFALFISVSFYYCLRIIKQNYPTAMAGVAFFTVLYCQATFVYAVFQKNMDLTSEIEVGKISQNLYHNFYQGPYDPLRRAMQLSKIQRLENSPVYTFFVETSIWTYLEKFRIAYNKIEKLSHITRPDDDRPMFILTSHPNQTLETLSILYPDMICSRINESLTFHNIIRCETQVEAKGQKES